MGVFNQSEQDILGQKALEELRLKHQVRLVTAAEDGAGRRSLPGGVYGYCFAPALRDFPLFRLYQVYAFEIHKLADGEDLVTGFVSDEAAAKMKSKQELELRLYPSPRENATNLVALPVTRIIRIFDHSSRDEGGLKLETVAMGDEVQ